MSNVPRRTRTKAQRLHDELQRMSTEDMIQMIQHAVERDYGEYVRSGRRDRDRRERRRLEREEQRERRESTEDEQKE